MLTHASTQTPGEVEKQKPSDMTDNARYPVFTCQEGCVGRCSNEHLATLFNGHIIICALRYSFTI